MITRIFPLFSICLIILFSVESVFSQTKKDYKIVSIAFYNVENLFDTENNPFTFDDDRTPEGDDVWTQEKYRDKLQKLSGVMAEIGAEITKQPPAILGICEVENRRVLEDLINEPKLKKYNYGIVHYDSPDRRGIDAALLYRKDVFRLENSVSHELLIYNSKEPDKRVYTRDQLVVSGEIDGEKLHFIVNHWPSRSGGEAASSYKREKAAALNKTILDSIFKQEPLAKVISMGDFNDDPVNKSFKEILKTEAEQNDLNLHQLYNPMENMLKKGMGTLAYRDGWNLFDQILVSGGLTGKDYSSFQFYKAGIFNKKYLITENGQYKGYPFRSYGYSGYQGGYSDHFPVYIYLIKKVSSNSLDARE
ncbi:endonuclease/exonuclease/phosphatase family protein [Salegentibacter sp. LM13S]|uniref:endonuclease/exonuclease/phosphatase family protein n=1 Tax=Salegentibacter lacus TaxID=2873599 RepID=UPI001CCA0B5C|nr:endonuclease/exonuclease/phosphatase family protein [Salegentibacter lacus]MBZ9632330.1 endonuclease/exonuclease/phosphatase family protein [Salegentibacter lacus]